MQKKIKGFINSSMIMAVSFMVLGFVFVLFPQSSLDLIRWILASVFMVMGIYTLTSNFSKSKYPSTISTILGTILLVIGIIFAVNPGVMDILPTILGAWFIVSSVSTLRYATALDRKSSASTWAIATSCLSILCGIILIINPWKANIALMTFAGIMMMIYAASSLVDLMTIKKNFNDVTKKFNKLVEGEVVEKKEKKEEK